MHRFQWGRAVYAIGGNETAALFSGIAVGRVKTSVYLLAATLAAVAGIVLAVVQGQGKADLATGYELDIIASAVVGGASLSGGRGSVLGAVLGTLIFGVLRNALPQIPGATFYDRLIVGLVVIVHRGDGPAHGPAGQMRKGGFMRLGKQAARAVVLAGIVAGLGCTGGGGAPAASPGASPAAKKYRFAVIPKSLDLPVFNYARVGAERKAKELGNVEILWRGLGDRRSAPPEGDPRVVHHPGRGRHRDLVAQRRLPDRDDRPGGGRGHPRGDLGLGRAEVQADRVLRSGRRGRGPDHGRGGGAACWAARARSRSSRAWAPQPAAPARGRARGAGQAARDEDRRGVRHQGGPRPLRGDHRRAAADRYPDLGAWISVGGWPVFTRNALDAGGSRQDQVHLLRHHPARARPAARRARSRC